MTDSAVGRLCVLAAMTMMAIGKVAYATWLVQIPSPAYVFVCFTAIAAFFLPVFGHRLGKLAWKPLLLINVATALCFLFFFFALKLVEPAVAGALQFGSSPILALLLTLSVTGLRPSLSRMIVCAGLFVGCCVLAVSAVTSAGFAAETMNGWIGLGAVLLSAIGSVLITVASKHLSELGWSPGAIVAHRCYLIIPMALILTWQSGMEIGDLSLGLLLALLGIGLLGTIIPIILLQIGIERTDSHTVLVLMAAQPTITFLLEGLSSQYVWSYVTILGLMIINIAICVDILLARWKPEAVMMKTYPPELPTSTR